MSAHRCWTAWNDPIGLSNCSALLGVRHRERERLLGGADSVDHMPPRACDRGSRRSRRWRRPIPIRRAGVPCERDRSLLAGGVDGLGGGHLEPGCSGLDGEHAEPVVGVRDHEEQLGGGGVGDVRDLAGESVAGDAATPQRVEVAVDGEHHGGTGRARRRGPGGGPSRSPVADRRHEGEQAGRARPRSTGRGPGARPDPSPRGRRPCRPSPCRRRPRPRVRADRSRRGRRAPSQTSALVPDGGLELLPDVGGDRRLLGEEPAHGRRAAAPGSRRTRNPPDLHPASPRST